MKIMNSISFFLGRIRPHCVMISLTLFLFFQVLAYAQQEDTLYLLGSNTEAADCYAVSAKNRYAFVASFYSGLKVVTYSDPENPSLVTSYPGLIYDIQMRNDTACYAGDRFTITDVSTPLVPDTLGSCCYSVLQSNIHIFDSLAFTLSREPTEEIVLFIIDISDPTEPNLLSVTSPPPDYTSHRGDIYKKGDLLYWADQVLTGDGYLGRIIVLDISDPTQPVCLLADTCLHAPPHAIWIKDNYAYVAEGYGGVGLMVLDVSDPYNIDSVGCFPIPEGRAWNLYIKGRYAYVCAHLKPTLPWDRVYILDISDPPNPSLVTYYNTPGSPRDVFVDEPYVLVADYTSLLVFEATFLRTIAGDVNEDGQVELGDVVFLINYLYKQGSPPEPIELGDVNGDCVIDLGDVVYLISYLYKSGPSPEGSCGH